MTLDNLTVPYVKWLSSEIFTHGFTLQKTHIKHSNPVTVSSDVYVESKVASTLSRHWLNLTLGRLFNIEALDVILPPSSESDDNEEESSASTAGAGGGPPAPAARNAGSTCCSIDIGDGPAGAAGCAVRGLFDWRPIAADD